MFERLLIANRGEIACRIMRTARRLGIGTVAVYSDADAGAPHVAMADLAVRIGPPPATESYLDIDRVIGAARDTGARAVHPGYGFLSENAGFARACAEAGLTFVGPPVDAIEAMGSKREAKRIMGDAGVPLVPGYHGADQDPETLAAAAREVGYPVLIKASAGGGGKGMRVVEAPDAFTDALASARREAAASFGDDTVLIEKYLTRPRHVEVQVFADTHGHAIHLFERDCSVQRRHQKILEEAPAPGLADGVRAEMTRAAVAAAEAIGYVGAGTVEFIYEDGAFYFMEMNTRLQVEHPVTEMITGLDLVEWQLRVAAGEPLPLSQSEIAATGHAFEARLYAEDPARDFLPSTGTLHHLALPEGPGLRVDAGVAEGGAVSVFYDPMIAKIVAHGPDRDAALARLRAGLARTEVAGVATNAAFLARLAAHPDLAAARLHTGFAVEHADALLPPPEPAPPAAIALAALAEIARRAARPVPPGDPHAPWNLATGWRLNAPAGQELELLDGDRLVAVRVAETAGARELAWDGAELTARDVGLDGRRVSAALDGRHVDGAVVCHGATLSVFIEGNVHVLRLHEPLADKSHSREAHSALTAPMPGKIAAIHVAGGDSVARGDALIVLEAMKMEHTIAAPDDGTVDSVNFAVGDQVNEGDDLVDFSAAEAAE